MNDKKASSYSKRKWIQIRRYHANFWCQRNWKRNWRYDDDDDDDVGQFNDSDDDNDDNDNGDKDGDRDNGDNDGDGDDDDGNHVNGVTMNGEVSNIKHMIDET